MRQNKFFVILAIFLTLFSCAKLPGSGMEDEVRPEISADWQNLETDDIVKKNKDVLSKIHYKEFFKNKELVSLIENGLENNKDLRIAALNVKSAYNYYRITRADSLPKVSAGADVSRQKVSKNSLNRFGASNSAARSFVINNYEANLASVSFELDLFGKLKYTNKAALNDFLSKVENKNSVKVALISQIANSYIQWLTDLELLKISKERLNLESQYYQLVKTSYENGFKSKVDLLLAKNSLELAKADLAAVKKITKQDKNIIISLIGAQDDNKIKTMNFDKVKLNNEFYVDLSSEVLLFRPDVMEAEYKLKSQEANIEVARANFFPSISLTGSYGFVSSSFSDLISTSSSGAWNTGAGINIPIFSGFKNKANLEMQKVEREIAIENYQKTLQNAFKEVNDKLIDRQALKIDLQSKKNIAQSANKIYKIDQKSFEVGLKNKIELIDVKRQYLLANSEEIVSKKKSLINQIELYKVLGGGLTDENPK